LLIVVFGLPATGKTFLARELASQLGFLHLNTDNTRKKILSRPGYTDKEKDLVYAKMFEFVSDYLKRGRDVVIDGTFYKDKLRKKLKKLAKEANTNPVFVEMTAPEEVVRGRTSERKKRPSESDADFRVYKKIEKDFEPLKESHLVIDSTVPLMKQVEKVRFHLQRLGK